MKPKPRPRTRSCQSILKKPTFITVTTNTKIVTESHVNNHLRYYFKTTPVSAFHPVRNSGTPLSPTDSHGQENGVPSYVVVVKITDVHLSNNSVIRRTNSPLSPSSPDRPTDPGTRGTNVHTVPVTVIVINVLGDRKYDRCGYNHQRHYLTYPVRAPGTNHAHSPTVDTTLVVRSTRIGIRDPPHESTVTTVYPVTLLVLGPITRTRDLCLLNSTVRKGVQGVTTYTRD